MKNLLTTSTAKITIVAVTVAPPAVICGVVHGG